ncbi:MAG: DUF4956 domain-containing protein [Clostridia bacterium]|nr:DUF4956 domain-containing protein [Clostridia bacterium]
MFNTIKEMFATEFTSGPSIGHVFVTLITACLLGLFIVWIYKLTYTGVLMNKGFCLGLVMLAMITDVIILTVSSNLGVSLGMVGALSIVRFRTAVKDANDTLFMFWAISAGIMCGTRYILIAVIATVLLGILYFAAFIFGARLNKSPYLLVVRYDAAEKSGVEAALRNLPKSRVKSRTVGNGIVELCLEIRLDPQGVKKIDILERIPGVRDVSAISYNADTLL